jgi:hypothetical protein
VSSADWPSLTSFGTTFIPTRGHGTVWFRPQEIEDAHAALDALLAEIQQLREALKRIAASPETLEDDYGSDLYRAVRRYARAALDGTPSATQTLEDVQPTGAAE